MKRASRGISQKEAKPGVHVMATWRMDAAGCTRAAASRNRSRLSFTARCMMRPASVSASARWRRSYNATPRLLFQLLDLAADRRLRKEQLLARLREAQKAGRRFEGLQQIEPQLA